MNSPFEYSFFLNALSAGVLASILAGIYSYFIVVKKMSFSAVGISHSAFGGVALGLLLGIFPFWSGVIFAVLMGILLSYLDEKKISPDQAIGILFPLSMAIGIIAVSLNQKSNVNIFSFLFGDILSINRSEIFLYIPIFILSMSFILYFLPELVYFAWNPEDIKRREPRNRVVHLAFNIFLALTIMISLKLLGIILVSALFVIPGSTSLSLKIHFTKQIWISIFVSLTAVISGLFISFYLPVPTGPLIVVILSLLFAMGFILKRFTSS